MDDPDDISRHIEPVARKLLGEPNKRLSRPHDLRFGNHGSVSVATESGTWFDHEENIGGGVIDLIRRKTGLSNGAAIDWMRDAIGVDLKTQRQKQEKRQQKRQIVATYDYHDENGALLFQVVRYDPKDFRQRRPDGNGGWSWSVRGARNVPYRLEDIAATDGDDPIYVVEGEKDADALASIGLTATCNAGGAGKWSDDLTRFFSGRLVYILPDNDIAGERHAEAVAKKLSSVASARIIHIPDLPHKGDVSDWIQAGGTAARLAALCRDAEREPQSDGWEVLDVADLDSGPIPPREWLLGVHLCRRYVTVLAAPGGVGKTTLMLSWALSLASGRSLTRHHVHHQGKALIVTAEDGVDEMRRRFRACRMHNGFDQFDRNNLFFLCLTGKGASLSSIDERGDPVDTGAASRIEETVRRLGVDAVFIDPFVKFGGCDENDNRAVDFVMQLLVRIADRCNVGVLVLHHTRKGQATAGDPEMARGAKSLIDAARIALTLLPMAQDDARTMGIPEPDRPQYVRLDDAKANLAPKALKASWYRLASVALENGTDAYPNGDSVQAIEPWDPPETWDGLTDDILNLVLDDIDAGTTGGERYSQANAAKDRAAWKALQIHCPDKTEGQCKQVISTWVGTGLLYVEEYDSPASRKKAKGLFVDHSKRPGEAR